MNTCQKCGEPKRSDSGNLCMRCRPRPDKKRLPQEESDAFYRQWRWDVIMGNKAINLVSIPVIKNKVK